MKQCNQINTVIIRIFDALKRRPLVAPAIIAVIVIFLFSAICPVTGESQDISVYATVRRIELNLDGSSTCELKTQGYGRVLYNGSADDHLIPGDKVYIEGFLKVYDPPSNPGEFDYRAYLTRRGITGVVYADEIYAVDKALVIMRVSSWINDISYAVRRYSISIFEEEDKGLAAALFLGDTSLLDESITRTFKLSNCSHLLAVSGTHFAGFLFIIAEIISRAHLPKRKSGIVYTAFCLLIGTMTGWPESVTRACVLSVCSFFSRDYISGMSLAVILLAVKDPYSLMSNGFLMSFSASLAIRLFGGRIDGILSGAGLGYTLRNALTPVMAATLGMMPFWGRTCYYFSVVHLITQITASLLATAACVFFVPSVITGLPMACSFIFWLLKTIMELCSSVSFNSFASSGLTPMVVYTSFIYICLFLMPETVIRRLLLIPSAIAVAVSVGLMVGSYLNAPEVTVVFIDVGQGDSCLIMSKGRSMLIDGGVEAEGRYAVSAVLDYYSIGSVDIAVATHEDEDHKGGLDYLASEGRIGNYLTCYDLQAGDQIVMTDDITFDCLWPHNAVDGGNDDSVVLRFEYNDVSILFTGDIGFDVEYALIEEGADIDTDILKVGHHGSAYSTSEVFLEHVSPEVAVISVVADSPYGHPAPATLERLNDYGCQIRRTDLEGAILYLFD